jgi:hypothetical protein
MVWVAELYPWSRSYIDVYDHFGLLRQRAVYAHCIHLDAADLVERLFVLMMLGDDRAVFATYIMGRRESATSPRLRQSRPER